MNILKIESLKDAKKEKVKVKKEQKHTPEPVADPVVLAMSLLPDGKMIEELYCLAQKYPGRHPLKLAIKSKLSDVIIESKMKVSRSILQEVKELGVYEEEKLVVNG